MEVWKEVRGFPEYSVSNYGNIRKDKTGRILIQSVNQYGVACIGLMKDGRQQHRSVAKLVAEHFLPRPFGAFDTPINLDGDRTNNHVDNLQFRPRWFAVDYNRQFREPYDNPITTGVLHVKSGTKYPNSFEAAKAHGLLEKDLVLSIYNNTVVWPTYEEFEQLL